MIDVGKFIQDGGQGYRCVRWDWHECTDGRQVPLAVLESECANCGGCFTATVPAMTRAPLRLNRRCVKHRRPGSKARRIDHAQPE